MENEYISVKEFAEKAGISVQAVYKGLNNRLNQYVKLVDNQKMLDIRALYDIYGIEVEQPIQPELTTENNTMNMLQKTIELLENELSIKNNQIEDLQRENRRLSSELLNISNKVGDTLQTITQTQLVDKMIEGKKLSEEQPETADIPEKKHWWKFWE